MNELEAIAGCSGRAARSSAAIAHRVLRRPDRVVVINDISAMLGGATGVALTSLRQLRSSGVPVHFITGDDASTADRQDLEGGYEAIGGRHIMSGSRAAAAVRGIYNRRAAQVLTDWIARHDTPGTIYHLHGWSKILSPSIFGVLRPVSSRLVVHAHDFFLTCPNGGYFNFRSGEACGLRALSPQCLVRNCDRRNYAHKVWRAGRLALRRGLLDLCSVGQVLVVHEGMVPLLRQSGLSDVPIEVLRNPVVPWREKRIAAERNSKFLYVGRLDVDKGADLLAAAARRAGVGLRMIGAGPLADRLARAYPEIEFTGWKRREDIAELCGEARAIVLPTRSRETFGLAALEAMMSGLPAIISHHALLAPDVVRAKCGFACDPQDEDGLAHLLARLASDDSTIAQMSKSAHVRARDLAPTPEEWCERLLAFYSATLERAAQKLNSRRGDRNCQ